MQIGLRISSRGLVNYWVLGSPRILKPVPHTDDVNLDILIIWLISTARLVHNKGVSFSKPSNSMVMMWEKR